jgi:hypothetical protein
VVAECVRPTDEIGEDSTYEVRHPLAKEAIAQQIHMPGISGPRFLPASFGSSNYVHSRGGNPAGPNSAGGMPTAGV